MRERLWTKWTYKATEEFWVEDAIVLGFNEITFVFLWILGGIVISLIFFVAEKIVDLVTPRRAGDSAWGDQKLGSDQSVV